MIAAVIDTTVLSNFAHVDQPQLLRSAFDDSVTVRAVMDELAEGVRLARLPDVNWRWLRVVELTTDELLRADELNRTLGRGESECIALAQSRQWIVLTDDRDARTAARTAGVSVSGTLGCLMNLIEINTLTLSQADRWLEQMVRHGYRCPVKSLADLRRD
ncbi:DUF3368 domain-containing protein [Aggregatilinea lenta]|uniref:DUF3368 domain-containing protein n=1 Tax=Aggregatilinea lenta TaxID=913108 RepID=UPI000E5B904B|nr:DUF3368 domain-containing protein [Aggregatilinea lenta]